MSVASKTALLCDCKLNLCGNGYGTGKICVATLLALDPLDPYDFPYAEYDEYDEYDPGMVIKDSNRIKLNIWNAIFLKMKKKRIIGLIYM